MTRPQWLNRMAVTIALGMGVCGLVACGPSSAFRSSGNRNLDVANQLGDSQKQAADVLSSSGLRPASAGGLLDLSNLQGSGLNIADLPASCQSLDPSKIEDVSKDALAKLEGKLSGILNNVSSIDPSTLQADIKEFQDTLMAALENVIRDVQTCASDLEKTVSNQIQVPAIDPSKIQQSGGFPNIDDFKNFLSGLNP